MRGHLVLAAMGLAACASPRPVPQPPHSVARCVQPELPIVPKGGPPIDAAEERWHERFAVPAGAKCDGVPTFALGEGDTRIARAKTSKNDLLLTIADGHRAVLFRRDAGALVVVDSWTYAVGGLGAELVAVDTVVPWTGDEPPAVFFVLRIDDHAKAPDTLSTTRMTVVLATDGAAFRVAAVDMDGELRDARIAITGNEIALVSPKKRYRYDVTTFRFERPLP